MNKELLLAQIKACIYGAIDLNEFGDWIMDLSWQYDPLRNPLPENIQDTVGDITLMFCEASYGHRTPENIIKNLRRIIDEEQ